MHSTAKLLFAAACLFVAGCSEPTIDTSSDESMRQSIDRVRTSLSESDQATFDEAIQTLVFSQLDLSDLFAAGASGDAGQAAMQSRMFAAIDGKTASEVMAEAERVQLERQAREREQALVEIEELQAELEELETKQAGAEAARQELQNFVVVRSRFFKREQQYIGPQPVIELTVRNGTAQPVSRAYFEGTLASPGRSVPWLQETFNYSISGGIEPGEEASWSLAPNSYSAWGTVSVPEDAILTVTVERLDGPDGEPLFDANMYSERDGQRYEQASQRLQTLKTNYGIQ